MIIKIALIWIALYVVAVLGLMRWAAPILRHEAERYTEIARGQRHRLRPGFRYFAVPLTVYVAFRLIVRINGWD